MAQLVKLRGAGPGRPFLTRESLAPDDLAFFHQGASRECWMSRVNPNGGRGGGIYPGRRVL